MHDLNDITTNQDIDYLLNYVNNIENDNIKKIINNMIIDKNILLQKYFNLKKTNIELTREMNILSINNNILKKKNIKLINEIKTLNENVNDLKNINTILIENITFLNKKLMDTTIKLVEFIDNNIFINFKRMKKKESSYTIQICNNCKDKKININKITINELKSIYGIGNKKAKTIIKNSPYKSFNEIQTNYGIGPKMTNLLKKYTFIAKC